MSNSLGLLLDIPVNRDSGALPSVLNAGRDGEADVPRGERACTLSHVARELDAMILGLAEPYLPLARNSFLETRNGYNRHANVL